MWNTHLPQSVCIYLNLDTHSGLSAGQQLSSRMSSNSTSGEPHMCMYVCVHGPACMHVHMWLLESRHWTRVVPILYLLNNNYGWVWKYVDSLRNTHNVVLSHLLFGSWRRFPFIHTDFADPFMLYIDKVYLGKCKPNKTNIYRREVIQHSHLAFFSYDLTRCRIGSF